MNAPRLNILVVDDEPSIGEIFCAVLSPHLHTVVYCRSGVEAFQKLHSAQINFDLLITDHHMPGSWSGLELVRMIRAKSLRVPTLVASGQLTLQLIADYRASGVIGFLPKPFDLQRIFTTVKDLALQNTSDLMADEPAARVNCLPEPIPLSVA